METPMGWVNVGQWIDELIETEIDNELREKEKHFETLIKDNTEVKVYLDPDNDEYLIFRIIVGGGTVATKHLYIEDNEVKNTFGNTIKIDRSDFKERD